jgi:hypothetical protein
MIQLHSRIQTNNTNLHFYSNPPVNKHSKMSSASQVANLIEENPVTTIPTAVIAGIRRPHTFLCLAPVHSASFPKAPQSPAMSPATITAEPSIATAMEESILPPPASPTTELKHKAVHRSSSSASAVSATDKQRFLKLGPVHWGGNIGDDDYAIED